MITKNPTLIKEWENCYEKEKVTELKIQQNKYNEIFHKKIHYHQILRYKKLIIAKL